MAHHQGHVLADLDVLPQVVLHIGAEGAEVGQLAAVDRQAAGLVQLAVPAEQFAFLDLEVAVQQAEAVQPGDILMSEEMHAVLVQ
ncbi:hypothetical protein D3C81_1969210 [compost metagenome]